MYQTRFKFQLFHLNPSMLLNFFQLPPPPPPLKLGTVIAPASKRIGSSEIMHAKSLARGRAHNKCHGNDSSIEMAGGKASPLWRFGFNLAFGSRRGIILSNFYRTGQKCRNRPRSLKSLCHWKHPPLLIPGVTFPFFYTP